MSKSIHYLTRNALSEPILYSQVFPLLKTLEESLIVNLYATDVIDACKPKEGDIRVRTIRRRQWYGSIVELFLWNYYLLRNLKTGDLVMSRSYAPAMLVMPILLLKNCLFVFDTRGMWVEEYMFLNNLKEHNLRIVLLRRLERFLFKRADEIICLTKCMCNYIKKTYQLDEARIHYIPTTTELDRWNITRKDNRTLTIGFHGSFTNRWYDQELFVKTIIKIRRYTTLPITIKIYTKDSENEVVRWFPHDLHSLLSVLCVAPSEVAQTMSKIDLALFCVRPIKAKLGSMPTKLAEYLASGVPVLTNGGYGDINKLIDGRCIHNVSNLDLEFIFDHILGKTKIQNKCRALARDEFNFEQSLIRYKSIILR